MKTENRGIQAAPAPLQDLMNSLVMERKKKALEISAGACARAVERDPGDTAVLILTGCSKESEGSLLTSWLVNRQ